ncbi:MAG: serine hydrolase domain-containing protein [Steroidobacteraceae bacterium]
MSIRSSLLLLSVLSGVVSCSTGQATHASRDFAPQITASIDSLFSRFQGQVPGCSLGVFEHSGRRYLAGFGMANIESHQSITPQSVFAIASVSKQFTALSILILARQQKLSLDESIRRIIPELPVSYAPITLRELLTHTSGLPEYEDIYNRQGGPDYDSASRAEQLKAVIDTGGPQSLPGTTWQYANTNYLLAAVAVERISGQPLSAFSRDQIFIPLGMKQSNYVASATDNNTLRAIPYQADDSGAFHATLYAAHLGPTGVQTSIADLERWAENFYSPKVGDLGLMAELQAQGSLQNGTPINSAFGLEHKRLGNYDAILHTGVTIGTRSAFVRFPKYQTTIALLCNRMDANMERLVTQIADELFK